VIRKEIIRKRLNKLDEYLAILIQLQRYSYDEFVQSPERYGSTERFLQLAIETINDMGNHVVAEMNLGVVNWISDVPFLLSKAGYLDQEIKENWIKMIGFRNVLVHDYLDIDLSLVYDILTNRLKDFEKIKLTFAQFL
jgi:uncharacterized protein YutE (UPF0331/DUF86 family)